MPAFLSSSSEDVLHFITLPPYTHTLFGKGNRRLPKISRDLEGKQTINEAAAGKSSLRLRQGVILCLSCLCVLLPWENGLFGGILLTDPPFWEGERPLSVLSSQKALVCVLVLQG